MKDREIDFITEVLEGLADAEAGRIVTTGDLLKRMTLWQNCIEATIMSVTSTE